MSLRVQLLGIGLLTLVLPWSGYRYVQVLESALRDGLEEGLRASAETVAIALADTTLSPAESTGPDRTIYALPLPSAPVLDGYLSDWSIAPTAARRLGDENRYWVAVYQRALYVFIDALDEALVYQPAPTEQPFGDRVLLSLQGNGTSWLLVQTTAQGSVRPQLTAAPAFAPSAQFESRASAFWRETQNGYAVELRVPLDLVGDRLGVALIDVDGPPRAGGPTNLAAYTVRMDRSWSDDAESSERLLYRPPGLAARARQFEQAGRRLRIVDRAGWVLFDGGAVDPLAQVLARAPPGLAEQLLRVILARGDPPYADSEQPPGYLSDTSLRDAMATGGVAWFARGNSQSAIVVAVAPVRRDGRVDGAVILEQGSDAILTLTNEALVDLMSFTLLASVLVAFGLLSYATYLSFRIRRLARAADTAMSPKGEIEPKLPGRHARDEIGDLSRSFTDLLRRLRDHTTYLTTLKGKLAHELRTPLAVVTTSLDNVEREPHGENLRPYLERMRDGTSRLDSILAAMSEATALERAIEDATRERFPLDTVVRGCVAGYRDVYRNRQFEYVADEAEGAILGSAELIAQMLDKLIDNAVSFSPSGSTIEIELRASTDTLRLSVTNVGSRLPDAMRASIFDSLVSLRDDAESPGHLGLGLYVVALITEFHAAAIDAEDLPDARGVRFSVTFPRAKRA